MVNAINKSKAIDFAEELRIVGDVVSGNSTCFDDTVIHPWKMRTGRSHFCGKHRPSNRLIVFVVDRARKRTLPR